MDHWAIFVSVRRPPARAARLRELERAVGGAVTKAEACAGAAASRCRVSDGEGEYLPDSEHVVDGLMPDLQAQVERIARRLADASDVKYLGDPSIW